MANMNLDKINARIFVNGYLIEDYDIDLYTINMSSGCISDNFIGYGATYSPSCEITMSETDMFNIGDWVTVQFYLDGEWVEFGSYVLVDEPVTEEGTTTIRLEGHLSTTFESEMVSFVGAPLVDGIKISDALTSISIQTGVDIKLYGYDEIYPNIGDTVIRIPSYDASDTEIKVIRMSCREFVAGLSLLLGGNAVERNGQVYITLLNSLHDLTTVFTDDNYSTLKRNKKCYTPDSVILSYQPYIGRTLDGAIVYTAGDKMQKEMVRAHAANRIPYTINVECDWIGINAQNGFLAQISFAYNPAEVEFSGYNPSLYAGNIIRVSEGDNEYKVMCGIVEYEWDGGLTTKVSSVFSAENNQANTSISTSSNVATYSQIIAQLNDVMTFKGIYTDFVNTKAVTTDTLSAKVAEIDSLKADSAIIKNIFSESIISDKAILDVLQAKVVDADVVKSAVAEVGYMTADEANLVYATINSLEAEKARIDELKASALTASSAVITELKSGVADINTLIFGSAAGGTIQTEFANSVIAQLGQAQIKSAMIESVSAGKITAGTIYTDDVTIQSKSGNMILSDNTIQISDGTRARVQIGKDASNDYSINIWDESGNLMFSKGGITDSAIKSAIIRNDMVSESANISASKLDIDSLFTVINEDNSHTLKSTKIYLDDKSQTLDVSFKEMSTYVDNLQTIQSTQGTQINTIQGQINSKVWKQDITTAVNDLEIGGRNLLLGSANPVNKFDWASANGSSTKTEEDMLGVKGVLLDVTTPSTGWQYCRYDFGASRMKLIKPDTYYTLSFDIYPSIDDRVNFCISNSNATDVVSTLAGWKSIIANQWNHISLTVKTISNITISSQIIYIRGINSVGTYKICNFKLEEGNKATDWTPAPEDTEEKITELNTKYAEVKQTADGLSTTVASHTTQLANAETKIAYNETVATQTAEKFSWLVKSGTSSTDFTLTDRVASLLSEEFNIDALTTFKNSAENGTSTVINGGAIKAKTIKAESIDVDSIFAQNISATGTITGGSFVGSSFEGATGSFTGSVTATSGKIGFLDIHSSYMDFSKDNVHGFYMDSSQIIISDELINASTSIKPDGIETPDVMIESSGTQSYSTKDTILNHVRAYELTIGDITINSGNPYSMSIASILSSLGGNLVGACLKKCWPHSTWAFSNTLLLNGTDLYISTTTTQVYTVSVVIFYTLG